MTNKLVPIPATHLPAAVTCVTASANTHAEFVFFMLGEVITQPVCISTILIITLIKCRVTLTIQSYLVLY